MRVFVCLLRDYTSVSVSLLREHASVCVRTCVRTCVRALFVRSTSRGCTVSSIAQRSFKYLSSECLHSSAFIELYCVPQTQPPEKSNTKLLTARTEKVRRYYFSLGAESHHFFHYAPPVYQEWGYYLSRFGCLSICLCSTWKSVSWKQPRPAVPLKPEPDPLWCRNKSCLVSPDSSQRGSFVSATYFSV